MNLPGRLWLFAIVGVGFPLIGIACTRVLAEWDWSWLWLALAVALTSSLGTRISLRRLGLGGMTITASDCVTLMVLILLNAWVAVLLAVLDATVVVVKMRVRRLDRKLFNLSQMAITPFVASLFFSWLRPMLTQSEHYWSLLLVAISSDNTAKIWDSLSGQLLATLQGHRNSVGSAVFSPDGSRIVTASQDRTAKVWEVATGRLLFSLEDHDKGLTEGAFSPRCQNRYRQLRHDRQSVGCAQWPAAGHTRRSLG